MASCPEPSVELLELLIRRAMARGLPVQDAEDVVSRSYDRVAASFDPDRGSFEALYMKVVDNECRYFWRTWQRKRARVLELVRTTDLTPQRSTGAAERAGEHQRRLLEALTEDERRVFATWSLQRHLPRGTLKAAEAAASLGLTVREWENAKRRLRTRISHLLDAWGLHPRDLFSLEDDERPQRARPV